MFAENNYESANNVFRKIYTKKKNRKFLFRITFLGSWKCSDWFKLHRITKISTQYFLPLIEWLPREDAFF